MDVLSQYFSTGSQTLGTTSAIPFAYVTFTFDIVYIHLNCLLVVFIHTKLNSPRFTKDVFVQGRCAVASLEKVLAVGV